MNDCSFFRIHTDENAYLTQLPRGVFTAVGKLVDAKLLSEEETATYWETRRWFEAHLPVPPFYDEGNKQRAITWYKNNETGRDMCAKMTFYFTMAAKYKLALSVTRTNAFPGIIIYEDEFQIAVTHSRHSGPGFFTTPFTGKL